MISKCERIKNKNKSSKIPRTSINYKYFTGWWCFTTFAVLSQQPTNTQLSPANLTSQETGKNDELGGGGVSKGFLFSFDIFAQDP